MRHLARRRGHLEAGKLGDVLRDWIVERPLALFPEHHHRDADDRLGHGREAKDGVASHWLPGRQILDAVRVKVHDLAVPRHERRDVGKLALIDKRTHRLLKRLQAVGREPDRLRGREVVISPQACGADEESDDDKDTCLHVSSRYRDVTIAIWEWACKNSRPSDPRTRR